MNQIFNEFFKVESFNEINFTNLDNKDNKNSKFGS